MVTKDGFSAQFWITDSEEFFLNWVHEDVRNLNSVASTKRGRSLYIALFIADPGKVNRRVKGKGLVPTSDVTYDFLVLRPDGTVYGSGKQLVAWSGAAPSPHLVHLANGKVMIMLDEIDPPGEYTVNVLVTDNVNKTAIQLQRKFSLED